MYRLFKAGLVVAAAFAWTTLMFVGAGLTTVPEVINDLCAYLVWPGMAITVDWLRRPLLGDSFLPLSLTFNTLIYSVLFGLVLKLVGRIRRRTSSEANDAANPQDP